MVGGPPISLRKGRGYPIWLWRKEIKGKWCKKVKFDHFCCYKCSKMPKTYCNHPFRSVSDFRRFVAIFGCLKLYFSLRLGWVSVNKRMEGSFFSDERMPPPLNFDPGLPMAMTMQPSVFVSLSILPFFTLWPTHN
jgi:hypothetical protein